MKPLLCLGAVLLVVVLVSGCTQSGCQCSQPSAWSKCDAQAMKTRTNYKCSSETNQECQSYTEQAACKTEMGLTGQMGLGVTISPVLDEVAKGMLKVSINTIPTEGNKVWVMLVPQGLQGDPFQDPNTRLQTVDAEAGKTVYIDTTKVANGVYNLGVMTTSNPGGAPWTDVVQTQLLVEN